MCINIVRRSVHTFLIEFKPRIMFTSLCTLKFTKKIYQCQSGHFGTSVQQIWGYVKLERALGKNEKLESFELKNLELEGFHLIWKVRIEVGKFSIQF